MEKIIYLVGKFGSVDGIDTFDPLVCYDTFESAKRGLRKIYLGELEQGKEMWERRFSLFCENLTDLQKENNLRAIDDLEKEIARISKGGDFPEHEFEIKEIKYIKE